MGRRLIAIATIINYIDRTSLSVLWPEIAKDLYPGHTADETKAIYALISIILYFLMLLDKHYLVKFSIG